MENEESSVTVILLPLLGGLQREDRSMEIVKEDEWHCATVIYLLFVFFVHKRIDAIEGKKKKKKKVLVLN
ncbi:hypothetical protein MTR_8g058260 [Medicago truncatula]|uniref:Uncharacterized protein n=1 Tax=Medicago truncatula TaxID=3880 RepID=G7LBX3_MEDTR|nr:hypothetical protein MTR_8g058260 [Medicago truncatula]